MACRLSKGGSVVTRSKLVEKGDILIGRITKNAPGTIYPEPYRDVSIVYTETLPGHVHRAERGVNASGYEFIRVVISQKRGAAIGDKFAAMHAQKGTLGKIVDPEDLPFCASDGIIPDVCINPLAFPSRMTVAMFLESLVGKQVALSPKARNVGAHELSIGAGTPFERLDL